MNYNFSLFFIFLSCFLYSKISKAQFGKALVMDGCTNYFETPDNDLFDFNEVLSIECWVQPNCDNTSNIIVSKQWCAGEYGYYLSVFSEKLRWSYSGVGTCDNPNLIQTIDFPVTANEFTHVAVVHNQSEIKLFINGEEVFHEQVDGIFTDIYNNNQPFRIGCYNSISQNKSAFFTGLIDEIRVWNIELNETLIQQRKDAPLIGDELGLALYYDMEDSGQGSSLILQNKSPLGESGNAIPIGFTENSPYLIEHDEYDLNLVNLGNDIETCEETITLSVDVENYKNILWSNGTSGNSLTVNTSGNYSVTVETELCKTLFDEIEVIFSEAEFISSNFEVCENESISINGQTYFAGIHLDTITSNTECDTIYQYQISEIQADSESISIPTCPNSTAFYNGQSLEIGSITDFTFSNINGCDSVVTVEVIAETVFNENLEFSTCIGNPIEYNGTFLDANTQTEFMFETVGGCDSIVTVEVFELPEITESVEFSTCEGNPIEYNGTFLDANTQTEFMFETAGGCDSIVTVEVFELPEIAESVEFSTCKGNPIEYNGTFLDANTQTEFMFETANGCDSIVTVMVDEITVVADFLVDEIIVCEESFVLISPNVNTIWNEKTTTDKFQISESGEYFAEFVDSLGCINTDTTNVFFVNNELYFPNVFSPNSDGINDCFKVFTSATSNQLSFNLKVFNRWGSLVFETTDINDCWDGTFKGKNLESGIYTWFAETSNSTCNQKEILHGDIMLIK